MPGVSQEMVDAFNDAQQAFVDNSDWFPSNLTKLGNLINAMQYILLTQAQMMAHGGSQAEELRFNKVVQKEELDELRKRYAILNRRSSGSGGWRQNQLSRNPDRWPTT